MTTAPKPREGTKQARLRDMVQRPHGATMDELVAATGWKASSIRGALSGALRARMGIAVESEIDAARGRVYRAVTGEDATG